MDSQNHLLNNCVVFHPLQGGPLPVVNGVKTPFIGGNNHSYPFYKAIYRRETTLFRTKS